MMPLLLLFVRRCREEVKGQYYGGPLVDKAVSAVFAALIWHTQEIRQDLTPFWYDIKEVILIDLISIPRPFNYLPTISTYNYVYTHLFLP